MSTSMVFSLPITLLRQRTSLHLRRLYTTQPTVNQVNVLQRWAENITTIERHTHEYISPNKVLDLFCTLPTRSSKVEKAYRAYQRGGGSPASSAYAALFPLASKGATLLPSHSLAFFHAHSPESLLGGDQTEMDFNPPAESGFTRRMWAGGRFQWAKSRNHDGGLVVGRDACATARVTKVDAKGFELAGTHMEGTPSAPTSTSPMVFVQQNIDYRHTNDPRILFSEERVHVYLPVHDGKPQQAQRSSTFAALNEYMAS